MSEENKEQVEKDARTLGWVPLEDFRGGEDKWVDADTFVQRGKEINPILRKNNEVLLKKLDEANKRVDEISKAAEDFRTFQKEQMGKRIKDYDDQIRVLKEAKKEAVSSGDGERVVEIDDAIDAAKEGKTAATEAAKEKPVAEKKSDGTVILDPHLKEWIDKNDWYSKDKRMANITNAIAADIRGDYPDLVGQEFLDKLSEEIEEVLPEKYKKGKPKSPVESSSGRGRPANRGGNTYENLPPEAKAACDKFVRDFKGYTREKYLADYYGDE